MESNNKGIMTEEERYKLADKMLKSKKDGIKGNFKEEAFIKELNSGFDKKLRGAEEEKDRDSEELASVFVMNSSTGKVVRYSIPIKTDSKEDLQVSLANGLSVLIDMYLQAMKEKGLKGLTFPMKIILPKSVIERAKDLNIDKEGDFVKGVIDKFSHEYLPENRGEGFTFVFDYACDDLPKSCCTIGRNVIFWTCSNDPKCAELSKIFTRNDGADYEDLKLSAEIYKNASSRSESLGSFLSLKNRIRNQNKEPSFWKNFLGGAGIGMGAAIAGSGIAIGVGALVTGSAATIATAAVVLKIISAAIIGLASIGSGVGLVIAAAALVGLVVGAIAYGIKKHRSKPSVTKEEQVI